jgi:hypothetical protein
LEEIRKSRDGMKKGSSIKWPAFGDIPLSEYREKMVFRMLFPWLYPGSNGDFNQSRTVDIFVKYWARQQLFLAYDRFAKDKTWCFYALNYSERRRNMTQVQWFFNNLLHSKEIPRSDTFKDKLKNNDTKFI